MKFTATAAVVGSKYIGEIEAETAEEALEIARDHEECSVSLCHQCASECEDAEVVEVAELAMTTQTEALLAAVREEAAAWEKTVGWPGPYTAEAHAYILEQYLADAQAGRDPHRPLVCAAVCALSWALVIQNKGEEPVKLTKLTDTQLAVLRVVLDVGPAGEYEINSRAGRIRGGAGRTLKALAARGLAERTIGGWSVTAKGAAIGKGEKP